MCLDIKPGSKPEIALTDIIVYKHVIATRDPKVFQTSYHHSDVELGVTYKSEIDTNTDYSIEKALHSYLELETADYQAKDYSQVLIECIIPKGSTYYIGIFYDQPSIASNTLIYVKVIKDYTNVRS